MIFHTGDVVVFMSNGRAFKHGEIHVIYKCDYQGQGKFEYSTNRGAWFTVYDFKLVRRADKASFALLDKDIQEEDEGEEL